MNKDNIFLSTNIKYLRKTNNKTQNEVAKACGKTNTAISNWEKGIREPDSVDLANIANLFNITVDDLMLKDLRFNIENNYNKVTGIILKKYREEKGLSLEDVASKINPSISPNELSNYENNGLELGSKLYKDICNAIGIDPNETWQEINDSALFVNLNNSEYNNQEILNRISHDYNDELEQLIHDNKELLTESDKNIIKTIIEERRKEINNEQK